MKTPVALIPYTLTLTEKFISTPTKIFNWGEIKKCVPNSKYLEDSGNIQNKKDKKKGKIEVIF